MRTERPQRARIALGVGLVLVASGMAATPAGARTPPAPDVPTVPAPAPAPAPQPSTPLPGPSPARTLSLSRGDGQRIRVTWPAGHGTVAAGTTVRVRVDQPRRGARKLTVSLLRTSAKGRILGSVQRTGVKRGTVAVTVPPGEGRRYSLRIALGKKVLRRLAIQVPTKPVPAPAPAAPAPLPVGNDALPPGLPYGDDALGPRLPLGDDIAPICYEGTVDGQIELSSPTVVAGEPLEFSVLNTGSACFAPVSVVGLERQDGPSWTAVPMLSIPTPAIYYVVESGQRGLSAVGTLPGAQPGTYRVTVQLTFGSYPAPLGPPVPAVPATTSIQATFAVTAP